jgi:hypothetical protein
VSEGAVSEGAPASEGAPGLAGAVFRVPAAVLDRAPDAAALVPVTAVFGRVFAAVIPDGAGAAPSAAGGGPAASAARAALWSSSARTAR